MKNSLLRSFAMVLVGVLLVFMNSDAVLFLVRIIGVACLVPALVSGIDIFVNRRTCMASRDVAIAVLDVACMAFGLWLVFAPGVFVELVVILLAVALLLFALTQLYRLFVVNKIVPVHWGYVVVPFILVVVAITALAIPGRTASFITVMIGMGAVASGVSEIVISLLASKGGDSGVK
jgi:uncharacterized membrane protein HdeD (DUF308 family)